MVSSDTVSKLVLPICLIVYYFIIKHLYNLLIITCHVYYIQFGFILKKKPLKSITGKLLFNNKIIKNKIVIIKVTYVMD